MRKCIGRFRILGLMTMTLLLFVNVAFAQNTVTGKISSDGESVPGTSVYIKNTTRGTVSNADGEYSINVTSENDVLVFSSVGYQTREILVGDQRIIDVEMEMELKGIDEVVVIGYGQTEVKDLTAPIPIVKQDELKQIPSASPMDALQGKVSGVFVSTNGAPGATPSIQIRGLGSVRGDFTPLFVVDGIITKDISFLDVNSIESVSVLKDASAASIYGNRAANGVMLITTKRGSEGKPKLSYEAFYGIRTAQRGDFQLLNNEQYIDFTNRKLSADNARNGTPYLPFEPADFPDNTDWFNEILRNGQTQKHSLSISGGSKTNKYFVGLNYLMEEGLVKKNNYQRVNVRIVDDIIFNKYLKAGFSTDLSVTNIDHLAANILIQAYESPPVFSPKNEDGTFTNPDLLGLGQFYNVAATLDHWNNVQPFNPRNISNAYFEFIPFKGLSYKSSISTDILNWERRDYNAAWDVSMYQTDDSNELIKSYGRHFNYVWDNTITYNKTLDNHRITAMAGSAIASYFSQFLNASNTDVPYFGDHSLYLVNGAASYSQQASDGGSKRVNQSYFGRVSYSLFNKYLLTATLRGDGSSSFPKDNRWGLFPSVGLGWILSQEEFLADVPFIDYLKIRASYGELGNSDIPQATYILPVDQRPYLSVIFGPYNSTNVTQGATITTAAQPDLTWEVVKEYNAGFEAFLFKYQLNIEIDYFHRLTQNAIFPVTLSATSGVSTAAGGATRSFLDNNADILNTGLELMIDWNKHISKDFSYNAGVNMTYQKNKITKLKTGTIAIYEGHRGASISREGLPIGEFYVYEVEGIFQNMDEVNAYTNEAGDLIMPNAVPGDFKYADNNSDGVIDDFDRIYAGNYLPELMYGINVGLNYRSFDLSMHIQGVEGVSIFNAKRAIRSGNQNIDREFYENMWNGEGTSNTYPSGDLLGGRNPDPNTFNIESGDYLRIKNITLGYTIDKRSINPDIPKIRIYLAATNPFTFHNYNGFTPEVPGGDATVRGYDYGLYPIPTTFLVGLNLGIN